MGWSEDNWVVLEQKTYERALAARSETAAWQIIIREARRVLKSFSTSFFIVTRFLPPDKREQVEAIYAAVRYPDEIVDTFPTALARRERMLDEWGAAYENALGAASLRQALRDGAPVFIASFARVVNECGIPSEHYRSFLAAMRHDLRPRRFATLDDLIDNYIYGSAIVVGYFLTYVYGSATRDDFARALKSARDLGIALQLTNFLRDVSEDQRRGRLYLPLEMVRAEGIVEADANDESQHPALRRVLQHLAQIADDHYTSARSDVDAFSADCRIAIRACIDVYGQLNRRIAESQRGIYHRETVPAYQKFRVLPPSKYWVLPMAYLKSSG
jgi:phytoene synthase